MTATPSHKRQNEGNKIQDPLKPYFNFSILESDIKKEVDSLRQQGNEVEAKQMNPFPVEVFPKVIQQIIAETSKHLGFPVDFIASSILYAASVAIGNSHRIEIKRGWQESAVIYLAIVGRAGTNKSHPLTFALQPIVDHDKRTNLLYECQRLEYETVAAMTKSEREKQGFDKPIKPSRRKFLLSDFTPEALAEVHKCNKRGIGVYVDELAGWFKNFNRYNKGSEMEFWLSVWSSKPINIDRKTGDPVFIPLPFISVAGTIQYGILNELAKDNRTQNGFIDRILFVISSNIQKQYWSESEVSESIIEGWHTIVNNLLKLTVENDDTLNPNPTILKFTPEARRFLFDWQKLNADNCNNAETEAISGIHSKLEMYAPRLALILELIKYACKNGDKQAVESDSVNGSLRLIEYFKNSALKIHAIISNSNPLEKHPADRQAIYKALQDTFTTEEGVQLAERMEMPERTFKRFLNETDLFTRTSRGKYEKRF